MASVDDDKGVIYDDEDYQEDVEIESEDDDDEDWYDSDDEDDDSKDLYDSPLDQVNEIMYFHEKMANLQNTHKELYDYLCAQITNEEG